MTDNDPVLRQKARDALREGRFPDRRPDRIWGGPGAGHTCAVCGEPISRDQMGFDLEFAGAGTRSAHVGCFRFWEEERDGPGGQPGHAESRGNGSLSAKRRDATITGGEHVYSEQSELRE